MVGSFDAAKWFAYADLMYSDTQCWRLMFSLQCFALKDHANVSLHSDAVYFEVDLLADNINPSVHNLTNAELATQLYVVCVTTVGWLKLGNWDRRFALKWFGLVNDDQLTVTFVYVVSFMVKWKCNLKVNNI